MTLKINDQEFPIQRSGGPSYHLTVSPEEAAVLILRLTKIAGNREGPQERIELHVNTDPGSEMNSYWRLAREDFIPVVEDDAG